MAAALIAELAAICPTDDGEAITAEASRDWWPLALHWALAGQVPVRAGVVCRPQTVDHVRAVVLACAAHGTPITPAGGRSGVSGGSVPLHGGVVLDLTALAGIVRVDATSGVVEALAGTFGPDLAATLAGQHGLTVGHLPQSFDLATVGGWAACRGAGQYSTRYGKIEDIVIGLEVVLADGSVVRTGGAPAAATGPDLTQLFIGSEGTLGVITSVTMRAHPLPATQATAAYSLPSFSAGIEACRRILRRGATPAVLRLYDGAETQRNFSGDGTWCALVVLDEGDQAIVGAAMAVVAEECAGFQALGAAPVERWLQHRNDVTALAVLTRKGFVVDTLEVAAPWSRLDQVVETTTAALLACRHARLASCHLSHSYLDGACLYFTFAATPPPEAIDTTYVALWDAGQRAALAAGANLSHHHGVGINRGRFMAEHLGAGLAVLQRVKDALDPQGIMNPGKLGLASSIDEGTLWP